MPRKGQHLSESAKIKLSKLRNKRIRLICKICSKEFYVPHNKAKIQRAFCSRRCVGIWAYLNCSRTRETSIEILLAKAMEQENLKFKKQFRIGTIGVADFYLPKFNLIIEADGEYWHRAERKERDDNRDLLLNFRGYKVLRFSETEINKSPEKCVTRIKKFLNKEGRRNK
jgi:very-short-patch-repair endonuclease